jgi:hypothetical protein
MLTGTVAGLLLVFLVLCLLAVMSPPGFRFEAIYRLNLWLSAESRSGIGSEYRNTQVVRAALVELLQRSDVGVFVDVPCGDFNWMSAVRQKVPGFDAKYVGVDRVGALIASNRKRHVGLDFRKGTIEELSIRADLLLVRDLLQHLSTTSQLAILRNLRSTGSRWLLINYEVHLPANTLVRVDPAPRWIELNLELPPFSLRPIKTFAGDSRDKFYGLFDLSAVVL